MRLNGVAFDFMALYKFYSYLFLAYSVVVSALASINVVNRHWPGSTWVGDRLRAGKPSRYITYIPNITIVT